MGPGQGVDWLSEFIVAHLNNSLHFILKTLQWHHNGHDGVSNHQPYDCLLNRVFRRRSRKASRLRVTGLCEGNSPVTGEFPTQRTSNAENVSIWWRHHAHCSSVASDAQGKDMDLSWWVQRDWHFGYIAYMGKTSIREEELTHWNLNKIDTALQKQLNSSVRTFSKAYMSHFCRDTLISTMHKDDC